MPPKAVNNPKNSLYFPLLIKMDLGPCELSLIWTKAPLKKIVFYSAYT